MHGWRRAFVFALLSGCIQPQLQPCGDLLCPVDSVCLPDNTCATQESIAQCMGKADGTTCSTALFTGSCAGGVCRPPVCGDGIISGSEQCDGPVSGIDCVEYGFDTGVPTCSDRCGLDVVASCVRFGWERVLAQPVSRAAASNGRLLLLSVDHFSLTLLDHGTTILQQSYDPNDTNQYIESIDINAGIAVGGQNGQIVRSDNGGPFVVETVPPLSDSNITVVLGDDGSVYAASFGSGLALYREAPGTKTWTMVIDTTRQASLMKWLGDSLYVAWDDGEVESWRPGGTFTHVMTAPSFLWWLALRPGGGYYITTDLNGSFEVVGTTFTQFGQGTYDQFFSLGSAIYGGGDTSTVTRRIGTSYEVFEAPILGNLVTDGTDLYVFGNGVYKFNGTEFARRSGSDEPARDLAQFANGEVALATVFNTLVVDSYDTWNFLLPNEEPVAIAGASANDFYVAEVNDIEHNAGTATFNSISPPSTLAPLDIVWAAPTLYAVGRAGVSARYTGGTWSMLAGVPATCDIHAMTAAASGMYAVSDCGADSVIWKLAGTTWMEIHRVARPLIALSLDAADNIYATGAMGSIARLDGTWNDAAGPAGISISATAPSDIWVAGGPDELVHYDGTLWSRVRIVGAASPHVLATERAVYICGASQSVLLR